MFKNETAKKIKIAIVRSHGLTGTVYKGFMNSVPIMHSYYGLEMADILLNVLRDRATENTSVLKRADKLDWTRR